MLASLKQSQNLQFKNREIVLGYFECITDFMYSKKCYNKEVFDCTVSFLCNKKTCITNNSNMVWKLEALM